MDKVKKYGYDWWIKQINQDEKRLRDDWWNSADEIVKKYKSKKDTTGDLTYLYNVFWANVGVLKAALYARPPRPMVSRTWADPNDNVARVAALILQRCLAYDFMKNNSPMDAAIKLAVEDRLIPGLGLVWLRYSAEFETVTVPGTENIPGQSPVQFETISEECVECEHVAWRDVIWNSARVWDEVWYVGRAIYLTKEQFKKKFKKDLPEDMSVGNVDKNDHLPKNFVHGKVKIYEIWCKTSNKVYWVSKDAGNFCEEKDDFLQLEGFFPCPSFLMASHTTDDYLPRPDYTMMRDQYDQINELNTRIVILEKALRVVGVYDKKNSEVQRILSDARENDMIPVEKWAVLAEAGGLKGVVDWFPLDVIAATLEKLQIQLQGKLAQLYELSGISDIMRGTTNARETLGAQELKSQYSSVRLQYLQMEVSTFVRQVLIIKADIICRHFQDETILKLSNIEATADAPYAQQAIQMLRNSEITEYKVDINEEGLALPDYNQEKQTRIEFLTTVGQFISQAFPVLQIAPGAAPMLLQLVRWVAGGMRGSEEMQGVLDQAIQGLGQNPVQPQQEQQKPPDTTRVQVEQIKQQAETQRIPQKAKADMAVEQHKADLALRNAQIEAHTKGKLEAQHAQMEHAHDLQTQNADQQHDAGIEGVKHMNQMEQILHTAMHDAEARADEIRNANEQAEPQREHEIRLARMSQQNKPKGK